MRDQRKQDRLIRQARFKLRASVQDIDYQHPRNLQPAQIARLAQGRLVAARTKPAHNRPCGQVQQNLPGCALGHNACLHGYTTAIIACRACCLHSPRPRLGRQLPQTAGSDR